MALIQGLLAAVARSAGKILNTAFGWATVLLFGKVPAKKQTYLSIITFGSVIWLVTAVGIAFPSVATFLLAFVKLPDWVDDSWIRLAMLAAAVVIPPIVGIVSIFVLDDEDKPKGVGRKLLAVLKGYPYTFGLALTLVLMTVFAPILKLKQIAKRWTSLHVPILIEPDDYLRVLEQVEGALESGGIETEREAASWMIRFPTKLLTFFAKGTTKKLAADHLANLVADGLEMLVHPSDIVISGKEQVVAHARGVLTERLKFPDAYLTWDKDSNEFEDRLRALYRHLQANERRGLDRESQEKLAGLEKQLRELKVDHEEWEVLYREKLEVERSLLRHATGLEQRPESALEKLARHVA